MPCNERILPFNPPHPPSPQQARGPKLWFYTEKIYFTKQKKYVFPVKPFGLERPQIAKKTPILTQQGNYYQTRCSLGCSTITFVTLKNAHLAIFRLFFLIFSRTVLCRGLRFFCAAFNVPLSPLSYQKNLQKYYQIVTLRVDSYGLKVTQSRKNSKKLSG